MYSLLMPEVVGLVLAVAGVTVALVLAVLLFFPRALQARAAQVTCPLLGQTVTAQIVRDAWTLRCTDVRRCSVLGGDVALCRKACLAVTPASAAVSRA